MRSRRTCTTLVAKGWPEQPRNAAYVVLPITTFALAKSKILICWTGQSGVVIVVLRDTINSLARMRAYMLHRERQTESTVHDWNDEQGEPQPWGVDPGIDPSVMLLEYCTWTRSSF